MFKIKEVRNFVFKNHIGNEYIRLISSDGLKILNKQYVSNESTLNFNDIPGPKSYPILGTLYKYWPLVGEYNAESLDKNAWLNWRRYGGFVREVPGVNLLHVFEPDIIEAVFRQNDRYPARRSHVAMLHYRLSKPSVYNTGGLLSTNGADWWRLRSTFQKNFTGPQNAKQYVSITDKVVQEFVEWIKKRKVSQNEDFLVYLNRLNLEVIGAIAFNEKFHSFTSKEQAFNSRSSKVIAAAFGSNSGIMKLDKGILWRIFKTSLYKKLVESQQYLEKISMDILLDRMNFFETEHRGKSNSLLDSFLQQPNLDVKDITGMMVDILMAAIDTTAYATSFLLYHLARNPSCQKKLHEEVANLLPTKSSLLTSDILSKAVYVRSCVKESLRLNPVSIGVGRLLQKDIILKGYLIPEGVPIGPKMTLTAFQGSCVKLKVAWKPLDSGLPLTVIVTQNMVASRLPQYVRNPMLYKPERWMRDSPEYENIHPFLSLPFGFGPRSCIARRLAEQNMCITIMRLVQEFKIIWAGGDVGVKTLLINKPDKPITLSFEPRCG